MRGLLGFWLIAAALVLAKAEPERVSDSPLASLRGLSERHPMDQSIGTHPSVVFAADFEAADFAKGWDETRDRNGKVLSRVRLDDSADRFGHSLCVTATLGQNTGGGLTKWFESSDRIFIRFYTRFAADCDYVHHFVTLRANRGLEGKERWSGFGGAGVKPNGTERFSTALEPWGNWRRWPPPGRWNFYSYWHEMKASPDGKYWGNGFRLPEQPNIPRNQWICLEFMLQHNTPDQHDGEQAFWVDGQLVGHWKGFNWRRSATLMANALTLESYVTDRWTKQSTNVVYFDQLVVAREYIGVMASKTVGDE